MFVNNKVNSKITNKGENYIFPFLPIRLICTGSRTIYGVVSEANGYTSDMTCEVNDLTEREQVLLVLSPNTSTPVIIQPRDDFWFRIDRLNEIVLQLGFGLSQQSAAYQYTPANITNQMGHISHEAAWTTQGFFGTQSVTPDYIDGYWEYIIDSNASYWK